VDTSLLVFDRPTALLEQASGCREATPRAILLVIDWEMGMIYTETRDPTDHGLPETRWRGLEDAYVLPQAVDASRLREWVDAEVVPRVRPLAAAFTVEWDDARKTGRFPGYEDAKADFDAWMAIHADPPVHTGDLRTAEDWLTYGVDEVRPESTDKELATLAYEIVTEAEIWNIVLVGGAAAVYDHLLALRDAIRDGGGAVR